MYSKAVICVVYRRAPSSVDLPGNRTLRLPFVSIALCSINVFRTRMWANVQRDGRPAEYSWCLLFNAAEFGWRPLLECRAVTLPTRESGWNLQGCPKLANRSQSLGGRSSPYYEDMWGRHRWLTGFSDCRYMPQLRRYSPTELCDGSKMATFCVLYFSEPRAAHFRHAF